MTPHVVKRRLTVLGVDVGLAALGWAVVHAGRIVASGTERTGSDGLLEARVRLLAQAVTAVYLREDIDRPLIVVEALEIRAGQRVNPAALLGCAAVMGACLAISSDARLVKSHEWRRAIGAGAHGGDADVRRALERLVALPRRTSVHERDAIGIALYGIRRWG